MDPNLTRLVDSTHTFVQLLTIWLIFRLFDGALALFLSIRSYFKAREAGDALVKLLNDYAPPKSPKD